MDLSYLGKMDRHQLLREIGRLIHEDKEYKHGGWRAISIIITDEPGIWCTIDGLFYPEDGGRPEFSAPGQFATEVFEAARQLRKLMQEETGTAWVQMLYQVCMPGPAFSATFENDNPERWSIESTQSVREFADMVDPAQTSNKD